MTKHYPWLSITTIRVSFTTIQLYFTTITLFFTTIPAPSLLPSKIYSRPMRTQQKTPSTREGVSIILLDYWYFDSYFKQISVYFGYQASPM